MKKQAKSRKKCHIDSIVSAHPTLTALIKQSKHMEHLDNQIRQSISIPAWKSCYISAINTNILTVTCNDQNQLFWLRNKHTPSILSAVQQIPALKQITQIKWTMAPCGTVPKIPKKNTNMPKKTLNAKDQTIIRASAETIKDDALKKALLKLAET